MEEIPAESLPNPPTEETSIQKTLAPAVHHQTIERQQHEQVTTVVDREIHQDHYHTTIQPITAPTEVLPEQHHHRQVPTTHLEFDHSGGKTSETQRRLHAEATAGIPRDGKVTHSQAPTTVSANTVEGTTHVHHHVHERVQPVVEKKVIERHIIHTTAPVHETHRNPAEHHAATTLPGVEMGELQRGMGDVSLGSGGGGQVTGSGNSRGAGVAQSGVSAAANAAGTGGTTQKKSSTGVAGNAAVSAARAAAAALGGRRAG